MEPEQQRRIASKGGKAAHQSGHAHEWDSTEAAAAGRKGGLASHHDRASFHSDTAAHHESQAERYRAEGSPEKADLHAETARSHGRKAEEYADQPTAKNEAASTPQPVSENPEQYTEPGRGAEARWARTDEEAGTDEPLDESVEESGEESQGSRRRRSSASEAQPSHRS